MTSGTRSTVMPAMAITGTCDGRSHRADGGRAEGVGQPDLGRRRVGRARRRGSRRPRRRGPGPFSGSRAVAPMIASWPSSRRATSTGRSSSPRCTPSAPAARAMSTRSSIRLTAPATRQRPTTASARPKRSRSVSALARTWMIGAPAASAASTTSRGSAVASRSVSTCNRPICFTSRAPSAGMNRIRSTVGGAAPPSQPGAPDSRLLPRTVVASNPKCVPSPVACTRTGLGGGR